MIKWIADRRKRRARKTKRKAKNVTKQNLLQSQIKRSEEKDRDLEVDLLTLIDVSVIDQKEVVHGKKAIDAITVDKIYEKFITELYISKV